MALKRTKSDQLYHFDTQKMEYINLISTISIPIFSFSLFDPNFYTPSDATEEEQLAMKCRQRCGIRNLNFVLNDDDDATARTFGGTTMASNVYPWVVFLHAEKQCTRTNSPIFVKCTGVLIDYNYVVAAAHCVHWNALQTKICLGDDPGFQLVVKSQLKVFYGSNDITRANVVAVSKISVPSFFDYDKPEPRENDIAVIRLQHRLTIERDFVVPICLLNNPTFLQGQTVTAVGRALADPTAFFGMSGNDLNHLNEIQTEVVSNSYCQRLYSDLRMSYNKSSMICGGVSKKGVLKGDCGGPLQVEKNGVYYLIGLTITSFSAVEYRDIMPDAFTKVSQHCPFIAAHTQNKVHCLTHQYSVEELENCTQFYDKILFEKYQKTCLFTDFVDGSTKNLCRYP